MLEVQLELHSLYILVSYSKPVRLSPAEYYCVCAAEYYSLEKWIFTVKSTLEKWTFTVKSTSFMGAKRLVSLEKWTFTVKVPILWVGGARRVSAEFV